MLEEMHIQGLGVIEDATLELAPGLTVVTGETGAGKTMVVTGLHLLFGGRADTARVRASAGRAAVEGRLRLADGSPAMERAGQAGADPDEDGTFILWRTVSAEGRSRAHLGGRAVPVGLLAELADGLVAVHGQSDQLRLLRGAEQRAALDRYAGEEVADLLRRHRAGYARWQELVAELVERTSRARDLAREADLLRHGIAEIEAVAPEPGEDVRLDADAARLANADALRVAARTAHDAVAGGPVEASTEEADAGTLLAVARRALAQESDRDAELAALQRRLDEVAYLLADLGSELASYLDGLDADPARLAEVEDRRAALRMLTRKYAEDVDGVLEWARRAGERLTGLDTSTEALAALAERRDQAEVALAELAGTLSRHRVAAAGRFSEAVTAELAGLAMPQARVVAQVRGRPVADGQPALELDGQRMGVGPDGVDEVDLLLQPHPDAPALPLARGASGGELSRVMLAVEVVFADADPVPTMVFDEVDAGIGGRAAVEVGRRLARLARDHQVIVVTHLAQVAAYADRHLAVDKAGDGGVTRSDVQTLEGDQRVRELARMLAGADGSELGRAHAAELLATASREKLEWLPARSRRGVGDPARRAGRSAGPAGRAG
ncbi:MAG TPA: DNA repair protein RecN [Mycobacteriales bacterium]|nr:DNA repair protein RecN [Mycobacteriales bacterium]